MTKCLQPRRLGGERAPFWQSPVAAEGGARPIFAGAGQGATLRCRGTSLALALARDSPARPSMGAGFERVLPRPLVLRHAYQSEKRRYTPPCRERTLLYRIVAENLETLLRTAIEETESGLGLPKYVEKEFREYLRCGVRCYGFTAPRGRSSLPRGP